jgi:hypothetical protein
MTFASKSGDFCRQFETSANGRKPGMGIACRTTDGPWLIEFLVGAPGASGVQAQQQTPDQRKYVPAGRNEPPELEAYVDRIIDGTPVGSDEEATLIAKRWRKTP